MAQESAYALSARSVLPPAARVITIHVDELPQECGHMSSSFAASTCRTTLAPFRQDISPTPRLYVMTRRIKYSKIVGAVGFEPTNPSLVSRSRTVAGRRLPSLEGPANWPNRRRTSPCVARLLPSLAPRLGPRNLVSF